MEEPCMETKKSKNKILEILEGSFLKRNEIYPTYIDLKNPKYIEIEDKYFSSLLIVNYYHEQNDLLLKNLIDTNINMNISMFYEKKDTYKMIRELTYHIGNTGVDLETKNQNSQDIELVAYTHNDAKYIRKQMQVNNQELYFLYLYITVFANDLRELEYLLNRVDNPELYNNSKSSGINISTVNNNTNDNSNTTNINMSINDIKKNIDDNTYLSDFEKKELLMKLDEIEELQKSEESKSKKWDRAKKLLSFILDKGADIAIMYIPQIMKAINK